MGARARRTALGSDASPAAFYRYSAERRGLHAEMLLAGCRGFLQGDGYAGFGKLYQLTTSSGDPALIEVSCWSHARRKFYDVRQATASPIAFEVLQQIGALFALEGEIRGRPPDRRAAARHKQARSLLNQLRSFLDGSLTRISGKSALAQAIRYALSRWGGAQPVCR